MKRTSRALVLLILGLVALTLALAFLPHAHAQQLVTGCVSTVNGDNGQPCTQWQPKALVSVSTSPLAIKSSGGLLGGLYCYNSVAAPIYAQLYDSVSAASITVGTTSPKLTFGFTASSGLAAVALNGPVGIEFTNGIFIAATTTAAGGSAPATALNCSASFD